MSVSASPANPPVRFSLNDTGRIELPPPLFDPTTKNSKVPKPPPMLSLVGPTEQGGDGTMLVMENPVVDPAILKPNAKLAPLSPKIPKLPPTSSSTTFTELPGPATSDVVMLMWPHNDAMLHTSKIVIVAADAFGTATK